MSDWTELQLARLRAERFRPQAWLSFVGESLRRSRELRPSYPHAHRTVVVLAATGTAMSVGGALLGGPVVGAASAAWWIAACLMVDWHLGMLDDRDRLGAANVVTLARAGVLPAFVILGAAPAGVALFALAGAADVLDGFLARSRGESTRLGLWLDGSVDGLMLGAAAVIALPAWAAAIVVGRYALPWVAIGGVYFLRATRPPLDTLVSGRIPGLVCFAGLALSLAGVRAGVGLAVAGALGGLGTFTASAVRSRAAVV